MGNPPAKPENNAGRGWGALGEGNSSGYESCRAGGLERAHVGLAQSPLIQSLPPTGSKPSCSQGQPRRGSSHCSHACCLDFP